MKNKEELLRRFEDAVQAFYDLGSGAGLAAKQEIIDEIGDVAYAELQEAYRQRKEKK